MPDIQATLDAMAADTADALEAAQKRRQVFLNACDDCPYLKRLCSPHGNEPRVPQPLKSDDLARLLGSLWTEPHSSALKEALLVLLHGAIKTYARDEAEKLIYEREQIQNAPHEWDGDGDDWSGQAGEKAGGGPQAGGEAADAAPGH